MKENLLDDQVLNLNREDKIDFVQYTPMMNLIKSELDEARDE